MRSFHWLLLCLLLVGAVSLLTPQTTEAQNSCPALVQSALDQMGENCGSLGRNNACYGFTRVDSTFAENTPVDFFSQPSDRAALAQIETLTTTPLDLDLDQWGIAVMNLLANVPGALPGQSVVFMLMGNTEVSNMVEPANTLPEVEPVDVTTLAETRLFSGPAANTSTVATLPAETLLQAEGMTEAGDWLRVYDSAAGLGWMPVEAVDSVGELDDLPAVSADMQAPMQAFQVSTAFNDLLCNEAPSLLAIQSPENMKVDLMANGVHINLGSLIMLRTLPPGDVLQIITIEGDVLLDPGTAFETNLLPGFATQRCLTDDNVVGEDCPWSTPVSLTEEELIFAQTVLLAFQQFNLENGASTVVEGQEITLINTDTCPAGATVRHTVRTGDTLFGLGLQYNTSVSALIFNNDLDGTTIVPGQELTVICGAQGPTSLPSLGAPPVFVNDAPPLPTEPVIDCNGLAATSPLDGLSYGANTFYWNAPNTPVDTYRVTVSGESGSATFTTDGSNLNLTAELIYDNVGTGYNFSWMVEALVDGNVVCNTPSFNILRESPPPFGGNNPGSDPGPSVTEVPDECEPICEGEYCYYPCEDGETNF